MATRSGNLNADRVSFAMLLHAIAALGAPTRRPETHEHALQHTQLLTRERSLRLLPTLSAEGKVEMKSVVRGAGEKDCSKCACWLWSDPHIESCYGCEGDYPQRDWDEETQTYKNPATCYDKFGETPISPTKTSECRAIKDAGECSTHPEAGTGCAASCMRCPGDFNPAGRPVHTVAECGAQDVASGDGLYGCGYKIMSYHLPVICEPGDEVDPERADYYPCGSSSAVAFAGRFCGKDHDKHTLVCAGNDVSVDGVSIALGTPGNFTTGKWEYGSCTLERQANKEAGEKRLAEMQQQLVVQAELAEAAAKKQDEITVQFEAKKKAQARAIIEKRQAAMEFRLKREKQKEVEMQAEFEFARKAEAARKVKVRRHTGSC